ncbi:antitoxin [Peptococcaceae bacterium SCADC1_2_3]|jgi:uncharacterized protein (DUF433 family)|nr:antitoxin [Peptococcaceae bacterium SCADC1_2_3]KFI35285.1 antitoxin [Peptococcaceae bacterium SCADC1_2_3]KFI38067.1 antitoxin [Peptococcaceae bacterium SCADC1_2_3]
MAKEQPVYQNRIIIDPEILAGKPVIKGTRIPVELVLKRLSQDFELNSLFKAYPRLTLEDVKACLEYAYALVEGEDVYPISVQSQGATI